MTQKIELATQKFLNGEGTLTKIKKRVRLKRIRRYNKKDK